LNVWYVKFFSGSFTGYGHYASEVEDVITAGLISQLSFTSRCQS